MPSAPSVIKFVAAIVCDGDLLNSNDTTDTVEVEVLKHNFPTVTISTDNNEISWTAPMTEGAGNVSESFESFVNNTASFGEWETVDGDGDKSQTIYATYPDKGAAAAYCVWNPVANGQNIDDTWSGFMYKPHTGSQYILSLDANKKATDNWLISPLLSGAAQTITFYARRGNRWDTENFEMLYSLAGKDTADFVLIKEAEIKGSQTEWTEQTFDVPEGTRYFAIRHTTSADKSRTALLIDDISFAGRDPEVTGYRVYRDSILVATLDANTLTYTVKDKGNYQVTVIYDQGESDLSNVALIATGINSVKMFSDKTQIYDVSGKRLDRLQHGVNIVKHSDGSIRKVIVK